MKPDPTVAYDEEADILYFNMYNPPLEADHSKRYGAFLWRYKDGQPIGLTVFNLMRGGAMRCQECGSEMYKDFYSCSCPRCGEIVDPDESHIDLTSWDKANLYRLEQEASIASDNLRIDK